ncbi:hypothetical protein ACFSFZ_21220 [Mixta tenebrionis]|uniref:hypothetical protein n=1 Tax=Mixta tenebrionis TaxID=2562439 RepID=UPI0015E8377F
MPTRQIWLLRVERDFYRQTLRYFSKVTRGVIGGAGRAGRDVFAPAIKTLAGHSSGGRAPAARFDNHKARVMKY